MPSAKRPAKVQREHLKMGSSMFALPGEAAEALLELATGGKPRVMQPATPVTNEETMKKNGSIVPLLAEALRPGDDGRNTTKLGRRGTAQARALASIVATAQHCVNTCGLEGSARCPLTFNATTGKFLWKYATDGGIAGSPCAAEERVIIGSDDRVVYCVNAQTGRIVWTCPTQGRVRSSPRPVSVLGRARSKIASSVIQRWRSPLRSASPVRCAPKS